MCRCVGRLLLAFFPLSRVCIGIQHLQQVVSYDTLSLLDNATVAISSHSLKVDRFPTEADIHLYSQVPALPKKNLNQHERYSPSREIPSSSPQTISHWSVGRGHYPLRRSNSEFFAQVAYAFLHGPTHWALWLAFGVWLAIFIRVHIYFANQEASDHDANVLYVLGVFLLGALLFFGLICLCSGVETGTNWLAGYLQELAFSMENMFAFLPIIKTFGTPAKLTTTALSYVVIAQIAFQCFLYIALSRWLVTLAFLPYALGVWLMYLAVTFMREEPSAELGEEQDLVIKDKPIIRLLSYTFGDRLLLHYEEHLMFAKAGSRWHLTLLCPVVLSLLITDILLEIDVTLTKIESMPGMYMAWTSSAFAAFMVPELFFIARMLFEKYFALKYGIGLVLVFFGFQLCLEEVVVVPGLVGCGIIISVIVASIAASKAYGMESAEQEDDVEKCKKALTGNSKHET